MTHMKDQLAAGAALAASLLVATALTVSPAAAQSSATYWAYVANE